MKKKHLLIALCVVVTAAFALCLRWYMHRKAERDMISSWIADWEKARACLFPVRASDFATARTLADLIGTDCDAMLNRLVKPLQLDAEDDGTALRQRWRNAMFAVGSKEIERVDREVAWLADAVGRKVHSLEAAAPLSPLPPPDDLATVALRARRGRQITRNRINDDRVVGYPSATWWLMRDERNRAFPGFEVLGGMDWRDLRFVVAYEPQGKGVFIARLDTGTGKWVMTQKGNAEVLGVIQDPSSGMIELRGSTFLWRFHIADGALEETRRDIDGIDEAALCIDSAHSWYRTKKGILDFNGIDAQLLPIPARANAPVVLEDCQNDQALVISAHTILRCTRTSCKEEFANRSRLPDGGGALLPDGRWIYAASSDGVVGIWTENQSDPVFYRLPPEYVASIDADIFASGGHVYLIVEKQRLSFAVKLL